MAETFNCPKCGAPINYNGQEQGYHETIACPYCGESVIVPAELRQSPPVQKFDMDGSIRQDDVNNLISLEREALSTYSTAYQAPVVDAVTKAAGWSIGSCVVISLVTTIVPIIIFVVVFFAMGASFFSVFNGFFNSSSSSRVPIEEIATAATRPTSVLAIVVPTEADTPTPAIDTTATSQAQQNQATRTAQNSLAQQQRNWPVVLQEKFANDNLHWNTGVEKNALADEDVKISGNQYIWKFTSKDSMGSFTYPDMPVLKDMYVSADVQMTTSTQNSYDQAGIIFRNSADGQKFYFFGTNPDGSYYLQMYDGNAWNEMISLSQTDQLKPKQVNHIAVSMQGSQILLIVNNVVVDSFEDSQLSSGTAGLGLRLGAGGEDATVIFTNFSVRAPKK